LTERDPLGDLSVNERIILKWIFMTWHGKAETRFFWFRIRTSGGSL
jgi:hypothetical protein